MTELIGLLPVDTAGAVAGAAVGTAAAVASAPFRGWDNSYAYDNSGGYAGGRSEMGWYGNWDTYAARNGIVCRPGPGTRERTASSTSASNPAQVG